MRSKRPIDDLAAMEAAVERRRAKDAAADFARAVTYERGAKHRLSLVYSDCHFPKHDRPTWAIILRAIQDLNPDELIDCGDTMDLESMSFHDPIGAAATYDEECAETNRALDQVDEALRRAAKRHGTRKRVRKIMLDGNHTWRFDRWLSSRCPPQVRKSIPPPPAALRLEERGWEWVDRSHQPFRHGDLWIHHGQWYGKHHAAKHLDENQVSQMYGHTHRPQVFAKNSMNGVVVGTGLPCVREVERDWEHMKRICDWVTGFAVIEWHGNTSHIHPVLVRGGTAAYGQHRWSAR